MRKTTQEIGEYGFVNGLGLEGDQQLKAKLIRRASNAVDRGDWGRVIEYLAAYGVGRWAGSSVRRALESQRGNPSIAQYGTQP
jgi:hypothetical protein